MLDFAPKWDAGWRARVKELMTLFQYESSIPWVGLQKRLGQIATSPAALFSGLAKQGMLRPEALAGDVNLGGRSGKAVIEPPFYWRKT